MKTCRRFSFYLLGSETPAQILDLDDQDSRADFFKVLKEITGGPTTPREQSTINHDQPIIFPTNLTE